MRKYAEAEKTKARLSPGLSFSAIRLDVKVQADKLEAREHNQWKVRSVHTVQEVGRAKGQCWQLQEKREARIAVMEEQQRTQKHVECLWKSRRSSQVPAQAAA